MTKKLIIASESEKLYTTKRLLKEGKELKWSTKWLNPYETSIGMLNEDTVPNLYLIRTTGIRYDDFDLICAKNYALNNFKVRNSIDGAHFFRSKENQALFFKEHQLNSIPTLMYRGQLTPHLWEELHQISPNHEFILKMSRCNKGIGVNLIKGMQSLRSLLETFHGMKDQRFLIQPFLPHHKELRVFIIKNEIHAVVEKSIAPDDFRGNAARSSGKLLNKIPAYARSEIERAFDISQLAYCGIDMIFDPSEKEFKFLEINAVPGFEQIEVLTKKNIAKEILNALK